MKSSARIEMEERFSVSAMVRIILESAKKFHFKLSSLDTHQTTKNQKYRSDNETKPVHRQLPAPRETSIFLLVSLHL